LSISFVILNTAVDYERDPPARIAQRASHPREVFLMLSVILFRKALVSIL